MNETLLLTAIMTAVSSSQNALGGWREEKVDDDTKDRLVSCFPAQTEPTVPRICVNEVESVSNQVVSGIKYRYTFVGWNPARGS